MGSGMTAATMNRTSGRARPTSSCRPVEYNPWFVVSRFTGHHVPGPVPVRLCFPDFRRMGGSQLVGDAGFSISMVSIPFPFTQPVQGDGMILPSNSLRMACTSFQVDSRRKPYSPLLRDKLRSSYNQRSLSESFSSWAFEFIRVLG